jgi:hypothetical protein
LPLPLPYPLRFVFDFLSRVPLLRQALFSRNLMMLQKLCFGPSLRRHPRLFHHKLFRRVLLYASFLHNLLEITIYVFENLANFRNTVIEED